MGELADLTGRRFGRLTVLERGPNSAPTKSKPRGAVMWRTQCDCGQERLVRPDHLLVGRVVSCGCAKTERIVTRSTSHGRAHRGQHDRTYKSWIGMKNRCHNPNYAEFELYGGRGITVCDRWLHSFENFLADMGERPARHSIDRIDPDGGYEPGNCRWADNHTQRVNRRRRT